MEAGALPRACSHVICASHKAVNVHGEMAAYPARPQDDSPVVQRTRMLQPALKVVREFKKVTKACLHAAGDGTAGGQGGTSRGKDDPPCNRTR